MIIETLDFRSVESADDPHPWYVVEVDEDDGIVRITEDKDGGRSSGLSTAETKTPSHVDLPEAASEPAGKRIEYGVTTIGNFVGFDPQQAEPDLRITLGIYFNDAGVHYHDGDRLEVDADTLLLLNFIDR